MSRAEITVYFSTDLPALASEEPQAARLQAFARRALPAVENHAGPHPPVLPELEEVEFHLVDDETIANLHGQFMDDPSPTDIITFQHGEVFISLETARRQAAEFGEEPDRELERYIVHGLLHLNGYDDLEPAERDAMHAVQEKLLTDLLTSGS